MASQVSMVGRNPLLVLSVLLSTFMCSFLYQKFIVPKVAYLLPCQLDQDVSAWPPVMLTAAAGMDTCENWVRSIAENQVLAAKEERESPYDSR